MAARARFHAELVGETSGFERNFKRAQAVGSRSLKAIGVALKRIGTGIASATAAIGRMILKFGALATAAAGAAGAAFGVFLAKTSGAASRFEQMQVTMGAFLKDTNKANKILEEIAEFGNVTPFDTAGLQNVAKNLLGAGIAGDQVVDVLKELAAVSRDTEQVGELGDALAKGFAKGKFQTEELNKFLERGINLLPELAKVTGKTGTELSKAVMAGLKFNDVRQAIANMSKEGNLFHGVLALQSQTMIGLVSTLKSVWDDFLRRFGTPINNALKPALEWAIAKMGEIAAMGEDLGQRFVDKMKVAVEWAMKIGLGIKEAFAQGKVMEILMAGMSLAAAMFTDKMAAMMAGLDAGFRAIANGFGTDIMAAIGAIFAGGGKVIMGINSVLGGVMASAAAAFIKTFADGIKHAVADVVQRLVATMAVLINPLMSADRARNEGQSAGDKIRGIDTSGIEERIRKAGIDLLNEGSTMLVDGMAEAAGGFRAVGAATAGIGQAMADAAGGMPESGATAAARDRLRGVIGGLGIDGNLPQTGATDEAGMPIGAAPSKPSRTLAEIYGPIANAAAPSIAAVGDALPSEGGPSAIATGRTGRGSTRGATAMRRGLFGSSGLRNHEALQSSARERGVINPNATRGTRGKPFGAARKIADKQMDVGTAQLTELQKLNSTIKKAVTVG